MSLTLKERPIFMIGSERSGTTLLMAMIREGSLAAMDSELKDGDPKGFGMDVGPMGLGSVA